MYTEYYIKFDKAITEEEGEIVIAFLGETDFESFEPIENGIKAYIQNQLIKQDEIDAALEQIKSLYQVEVIVKEIENINWNEEWEKNYEPVFVNENCVIRAPFHHITPSPDYDIIIEPKMAFGTGHHETTFLISDILFSVPVKNKVVCDAGTGSGVLSIIASKLNAKSIFAYDIDEWSYNNTKENLKVNEVKNVIIKKGDVRLIKDQKFDLMIANINRNILLNDVEKFAPSINPKGMLIVSGFYSQDLPIIKTEFEKHNLKLDLFKSKNHWIAAIFKKI